MLKTNFKKISALFTLFLATQASASNSVKTSQLISDIELLNSKLANGSLSEKGRSYNESLRFHLINLLAKEEKIRTCDQLNALVPAFISGFYLIYVSETEGQPYLVDCQKNPDGSLTQAIMGTPKDIAPAKTNPMKDPYIGTQGVNAAPAKNCSFANRTVEHGKSVVGYQSTTACMFSKRMTCDNGILPEASKYRYASCEQRSGSDR